MPHPYGLTDVWDVEGWQRDHKKNVEQGGSGGEDWERGSEDGDKEMGSENGDEE